MTGRRMLEVPADKYDKEVMRKLKVLAAAWQRDQRELVWEAILQFVERYPIDKLSRLPNPFEGEEPPD